jgi:hypothetical protein
MRGRAERDLATGELESVTVAGAPAKGFVVRLIWLVCAAVVLAFYKPWDSGSKSPPVSAYLPTLPTPEVSPSPRPTTELDVVAGFCLEPSGWRVYSSERWGGQTVRSWTALTPIDSATGPTDARIPVIPVVSQAVLAIGFCAPVSGSDKPPADATNRVYRLTEITIAGDKIRQAAALAPRRIAPVGRASYLGVAYAPPDGASWQDGVYVIHVEGSAYARWFGIRVEILDRASSQPSG